MRILLTGGTGYLGKHLLRELLRCQNEVYVIVRTPVATENTDALGNLNYCLADQSSLEELFKIWVPDIVIHTAASYGRSGETLHQIVKANLYFPTILLDLAIKHGVKYFINTDTSLPKGLNAYSRSKKQFVEWLEVCSTQINVLNLQLEYFYGPGDSPSKFITYLLKELNSGRSHIDFTEATPFRDFIYIDDVIAAISVLIVNLNIVVGFKTVPIGSGNSIMLKEIIIQTRKLAKAEHVNLNFGALPMRENEIMHSCADISILKSLGWHTEYSFEQGILKTIDIEKTTHD